MYSIAVLDDRNEQRTTLVRSIGTALPEGWGVIECPLLDDQSAYSEWLISNDVFVLVVDQVLNEQAVESVGNVDYKGHEVIEAIRKTFPDYPVFIVTAHPSDEDLADHAGNAEDVITRNELTGDVRKYVARMVRAGQRFHAEHERRLAEMTDLATKIALGSASDDEKEELKKLQRSLGSHRAANIDVTREEALTGVEERVTKLETLQREVEALLPHKESR